MKKKEKYKEINAKEELFFCCLHSMCFLCNIILYQNMIEVMEKKICIITKQGMLEGKIM